MATFFMFGKYTADALKGISPDRTKKAVETLVNFGGKVDSMYTLLGEHDLVLIVDFPGIGEAMKASVALSKQTGIGFSTEPAISVDQFDKLMMK